MDVKDSVSILLCVPLQRGGRVSRTVSVCGYACCYRWKGVKDSVRAMTGGGGGVCVGGGGSRTVSVCGYVCYYRGVDRCQGQSQ